MLETLNLHKIDKTLGRLRMTSVSLIDDCEIIYDTIQEVLDEGELCETLCVGLTTIQTLVGTVRNFNAMAGQQIQAECMAVVGHLMKEHGHDKEPDPDGGLH